MSGDAVGQGPPFLETKHQWHPWAMGDAGVKITCLVAWDLGLVPAK